ncbi:MAG: DUF721 domain-containing protein [Candidatus Cloacimonetes bacterium]|jgi:predicted nucleic acid-binding Zn ribbon protein|nr:DUF721 domain-containing protein [Candidatus Cloacimonadota bacterium]
MRSFKSGNAVKDLVYSIAGEDNHDLIAIAFGWKSIVGDLLAERASIIKLENGVLFIAVTNNVWMQELVLRRSQLISDVNRMLHVKLSNIVFFLKQSKKGKRR